MRQAQAFLSTYTADVSGVCSALYELKGMTVMHDPSGCNTTYNTHDEPRWYTHDSLIYISGLAEIDAIMGDDQKLIDDVVYAAKELKPEFVALAGTPIPMMTGFDFPAVAAAIERELDIPVFGFRTNGMHSYINGASMALSGYAERMIYDDPGEVIPRSVNILGATPLDFSINGAVEEMKLMLEEAGWKVIGTWAMDSTPEDLKNAGRAQVNLLVSETGRGPMEVLKRKFGTPCVTGTPCGPEFNKRILECLDKAAAGGCDVSALVEAEGSEWDATVIGEGITCRSLASQVFLKYGKTLRVITPLEYGEGVLSAIDLNIDGEEDMTEAVAKDRTVIADPIFKRIVPADCRFIDLPHEAYSGRIYRKTIPNMVRGWDIQI